MMRTTTLIVIAWTVSTIAATPQLRSRDSAPASTIDTTILKNLRWRSLGPDRGGRSIAVSGVKGRPKIGYFGATGGGL